MGLGVDVDVHRITDRLKWHKPLMKTREETRLEDGLASSSAALGLLPFSPIFARLYQAQPTVVASHRVTQINKPPPCRVRSGVSVNLVR